MSISLDQLTQILAKVGIPSSWEEEILTAAESLITPPEAKTMKQHTKHSAHLMTNNYTSRRSRRITRNCDTI
jgi:hypothetical protein